MAQMAKKTGVVKALEGPMAVVTTTRETECENCAARASCEAMGGGGTNATVTALNTANAQVGDTVTIAMRTTSLLKASFIVYMVPVLGLIGGILLGFLTARVIGISENIAVGVFAGLFLAGSFMWLKKKGAELGKRREFVPEIIARRSSPMTIPESEKSCSLP
jgi:sigma-E factor negative regulatory protein RseC